MTGKEALEILEKSILDTIGTTIEQEDCIYYIEKDLTNFEKIKAIIKNISDWDDQHGLTADQALSYLYDLESFLEE